MKKVQKLLSTFMVVVLLLNTVLPTFVYATGEGVEYVEFTDVREIEPNDDSNWLLTSVEALLAGIVNGLANSVNFLISKAVGQQVIIDDLIFNYPGLPVEERWLSANTIRLF